MFERLKRVFSGGAAAGQPQHLSREDSQHLSHWAKLQGFSFFEQSLRGPDGKGKGDGFLMDGAVQGKPWHLECGLPGRDFVKGHEVRARSELGVLNSVAVVLMSRPLKAALEKRAYALYTDSLQTVADPKLPEEMRWLAVYPEVGWADAPSAFFDRYAVLAARREQASAWITPGLIQNLSAWPAPGLPAEVPFIMTLMHGKCYLRMQYSHGAPTLVEHAVNLFTAASASALIGVAQAVHLESTTPENPQAAG